MPGRLISVLRLLCVEWDIKPNSLIPLKCPLEIAVSDSVTIQMPLVLPIHQGIERLD